MMYFIDIGDRKLTLCFISTTTLQKWKWAPQEDI